MVLQALLICFRKPKSVLHVVKDWENATPTCFVEEHRPKAEKLKNKCFGPGISQNASQELPAYGNVQPQQHASGAYRPSSAAGSPWRQLDVQRKHPLPETTFATSTSIALSLSLMQAASRDSLICGNVLAAVTVVDRRGDTIHQNPASVLYFGDRVTRRPRQGQAAEETLLSAVFRLDPAKLERLLHDVLHEECGRWRGIVRVPCDLLDEPQGHSKLPNAHPIPHGGSLWRPSLQFASPPIGAAPGEAPNAPSPGPSPSPSSSPRPFAKTIHSSIVEFEGEDQEVALPLNAMASLAASRHDSADVAPPHNGETDGTYDNPLTPDVSMASQAGRPAGLVAPHLANRVATHGGGVLASPGGHGTYGGCEQEGGGLETQTAGIARTMSGSCTPMPIRASLVSPSSRGTAAVGATAGVPTTSSGYFGHVGVTNSFSRPSLATDAAYASRYGNITNGCNGRISMMGHRNQPLLDPGTLIIQEACASKGGPNFISASGNGHAVQPQQPQPQQQPVPSAVCAGPATLNAFATATAVTATSKTGCPLGTELGDIRESTPPSSLTSNSMRWDSCGNPLATSTFGLALGRQYEDLPAAATPMFALASMIVSPNSYNHHHHLQAHAISSHFNNTTANNANIANNGGGTHGGIKVKDLSSRRSLGQRRSLSHRTLSAGPSALPRTATAAGFLRASSSIMPSPAVPISTSATVLGLNSGSRTTAGRADPAGAHSRVVAFASSLRNAPTAAQLLAEASLPSRAGSMQRLQDGSQSPSRLEASLAASSGGGRAFGAVLASSPGASRMIRSSTDLGMRANRRELAVPAPARAPAQETRVAEAPAVAATAQPGFSLAASGASTPTCIAGSGMSNDAWDACNTGPCTSMFSAGTSGPRCGAVNFDCNGLCGDPTPKAADRWVARSSTGPPTDEKGRRAALASQLPQKLMAKDAEGWAAGAAQPAPALSRQQGPTNTRSVTAVALVTGPDLPTVDWPLTSAATSANAMDAHATAGCLHPDFPSLGSHPLVARLAQYTDGSSASQHPHSQPPPPPPPPQLQQSEELASRTALQEELAEGRECWHEVWATRAVDPVTGEDIIVVSQHDVTAKVVAERHLALVMEAEHRLLEQLFPKHILTHITEEWIAEAERTVAAAATGNAPRWEGGSGRVRKSSSTRSNRWRPVVRDCNMLATWHQQVTLLFADIKGFTPMCEQVSPRSVMTMLNDLFSRFDSMLDKFGVFKVETIGDCYFVAGGLIHEDEDGMAAVRDGNSKGDPLHAEKVFMFAKAMLAAAREVRMPTSGQPVQVRIGIHSGPVVSGVVGTRMPRFCLFGDTVNTTSRMESTGVPGAIHASASAYALLRSEAWEPTGGIEVKGKGYMQTYLWRPMLGEEEDGTERKLPASAAAAAAALAKVAGSIGQLPFSVAGRPSGDCNTALPGAAADGGTATDDAKGLLVAEAECTAGTAADAEQEVAGAQVQDPGDVEGCADAGAEK